MMRKMTKTTPPPTALPMPREGPPPPALLPRGRRPSSEAIFCCSLRRISSRSGGPSLFFLPHWGSLGGIWECSSRALQGARGVASCLGQHFTKCLDAGTGERTYLDIQNLTIGIAHRLGPEPAAVDWVA